MKLPILLHFQILSDCLIRRHLRSPTWSELGTHDHPGSARLIFYPKGHTYGCRTPDFLNSIRCKPGYWTKRFIMLSPYMLLVFGKAQEGTYVLPIGCAVHQNRKIQILSICLTRRHLRSPTWSELGTHDHSCSARLIFYPEGHTYGCRTLDFLNSNRRKSGTGRKESLYCPPIFSLFLGRLKKPRMCC